MANQPDNSKFIIWFSLYIKLEDFLTSDIGNHGGEGPVEVEASTGIERATEEGMVEIFHRVLLAKLTCRGRVSDPRHSVLGWKKSVDEPPEECCLIKTQAFQSG